MAARRDVACDRDIRMAAKWMNTRCSDLHRAREARCGPMRKIAWRLEGVSKDPRKHQVEQVSSIAGEVRVAFTAAACVLNAYPDVNWPRSATGSSSVGALETQEFCEKSACRE